MHNFASLVGRELMSGLNFIEELATLQKFDCDVDRIVGFENGVEFHDVLVVQLPHQVHLVDQ